MFTTYDLFSLEILFIGSWIQVFERKMSDGPLQNHWLLELWTKHTSKFEVEKFNGTNKNFGMWQCEAMDVLNS